LKRQLKLSDEFQFKRQKISRGDGSFIDLNILELYYIKYTYSLLEIYSNSYRFITTYSQSLRLVKRDEFYNLFDYINSDVLT
jgi:hypothetical protein